MVTPSLSSCNTDKDMNPSTTKRRKRLRIARHKREAVRYYTYIHSEQGEIDLNKGLKAFVSGHSEMVSGNIDALLY